MWFLIGLKIKWSQTWVWDVGTLFILWCFRWWETSKTLQTWFLHLTYISAKSLLGVDTPEALRSSRTSLPRLYPGWPSSHDINQGNQGPGISWLGLWWRTETLNLRWRHITLESEWRTMGPLPNGMQENYRILSPGDQKSLLSWTTKWGTQRHHLLLG